jgi:hypothetical protein
MLTRGGTVYHSTDGGATWSSAGSVSGTGAPAGPSTNTDVAAASFCELGGNLIIKFGNAVAYNAARAFVAKDKSREVPVHLRNAPTQLMKELGHGRAYRYAHDEPQAYAAGENYLPEGMPEPGWYQPTGRGLEAKIAEKMAFLRRLDEQVKDAPGSA